MSAEPIPDLDLSATRRALIIKPSSLGDIVHTLPSLHDLKTAHPHLEITWLANTEWLPLLDGHPQLAGTLEFPRQRLRGARNALRSLRWLMNVHRQIQPDLVLDFQGLLRSGLISWFTHCRTRIGLADAREGAKYLYTHQVPVDAKVHAVERYRQLVAALGIDSAAPAQFLLPDGEPLENSLPQEFIALHPFSRGDGKSLTIEQVLQLCTQLDRPVVLLGRCAPEIRHQLQLPDACLNLLNTTSLGQLIHCLRKAALTISVDSGPMHLAAAIHPSKLLSIHTWSDPHQVGPYSSESWVWKAGEITPAHAVSTEQRIQKRAFKDNDIPGVVQWAQR